MAQWMNNLLEISTKCENISAAEAWMTVSGIRGYMARGFFTFRLYISARLPQQEDTDLLLVDVVYHQGEGILAGVSNGHHLPLLVLQVTAVLDERHITHVQL